MTTGPMTVPFIMAMGVGMSSVRGDKNAYNDSFGLVALSSIGPILAVLILGSFYDTSETAYSLASVADVATTREVVLILAKKEDKRPIMQAIFEQCGMTSEAHGTVLSLPVDGIIGLDQE